MLVWYQFPALQSFYLPGFEPETIDEFLGFEWGSSKEKVVKKFGSSQSDTFTEIPVSHDEKGMGSRIKYLNKQILNEWVDVNFVFSPQSKLIKGAYEVKFEEIDRCERIFQKFAIAIEKSYPQLYKIQERNNPTELPICKALKKGRAKWKMVWKNTYSPEGVVMKFSEDNPKRLRIVFKPNYSINERSWW